MEQAAHDPFAALARPLVRRPGQYIPDPQGAERAKRGEARRKECRFPAVPNPWGLNGTESTVLTAITDGKPYAVVGKELAMAEKTVAAHVQRAKNKMNAATSTHAILMFDRWSRGNKPQDVEVVLRFVAGRPSVEMREVKP